MTEAERKEMIPWLHIELKEYLSERWDMEVDIHACRRDIRRVIAELRDVEGKPPKNPNRAKRRIRLN